MHEKYKIGSVVLGYVTGIKEYGIFVQLDNNTSGLIHISEISNKYIESIDNHYSLSTIDLDYRITKNRGSKIKETPSGFKNLAIFLEKSLKEKKI